MNYLSVCSGIEAATVAWHSLGWKAVGYSEIEAFPSGVLKHHYPDVTNFGDMTKYKEWKIERTVELLVGGTPCQSFSVAGLRKGLADPRGNLALTYCGILDHFRPKWFVWENVPGVLSSNGGRDFGSFLGALVELRYGFAYRVLDAQYFGVAQRRRRVFVVGYLGDWRPAAEVLFEPESLRGDSPPRRGKRKEIAQRLTRGVGQCYDPETESLIPSFALQGAGHTSQNTNEQGWSEDISYTLNTTDVHGVAQPIPFGVGEQSAVGHCLRSGASKADKHESTTYVAQPFQQTADCLTAAYGTKWNGNASADNGSLFAIQNMAVRRLTPVECERLQGFPDNYTNIPWRKQSDSPDGPRYKAIGNSMAVPVMAWIGQRIANYEQQTYSCRA